MSVDSNSHYARMSPQDVTVERDWYMARSNTALDVDAETLMGVAGSNGAGKSTLFNAIDGLLAAHQGTSNP